ncbi:uncharacterized protein RCC_03594 [Ramularia collo-cygni]|uniref:Uncharacterized protein n=1 Tax=Ramularia collo-cygni TaxID=112498 RepID=A0A2D3USH8_9PEZI|nr:uncharacterized protein RCC_03594 [Ramularia collo-cygni]CZT17758.1 uncharacterized protein RCC_03594 [Ramularia collo-cygni]
MPHCTKCQRFHAPGQLNAFDNGWGELQLPGSLCECGDECSELDCISTCECEECPRTRYFWSPHLFWTSPGGLYENYESMYANGLGFYRYREGFVIDYENCTPLELKTFVKQRRIPDPCVKFMHRLSQGPHALVLLHQAAGG